MQQSSYQLGSSIVEYNFQQPGRFNFSFGLAEWWTVLCRNSVFTSHVIVSHLSWPMTHLTHRSLDYMIHESWRIISAQPNASSYTKLEYWTENECLTVAIVAHWGGGERFQEWYICRSIQQMCELHDAACRLRRGRWRTAEGKVYTRRYWRAQPCHKVHPQRTPDYVQRLQAGIFYATSLLSKRRQRIISARRDIGLKEKKNRVGEDRPTAYFRQVNLDTYEREV